ncbi:hypothetical protein [Agromyces sp. GXQ0307]|uniref:hypothetical protein n=1 Tax=Agromyces sp. GXQ0307 TaxID=3377835 RepID=UPI00383A995E
MACDPLDFICQGREGVGNIISAAANDSLRELVNQVMEGWGKALASIGTLWVSVPTPILTSGSGAAEVKTPPEAAAFNEILGYVMWIGLTICILSLIAVGAMIGLRRRRGEGEGHLGRLGIILLAVVLISGGSAAVAALLPTVAPSGSSSTVTFLQQSLWYYVGGLAVLSTIVAGIRMAWEQRAQPGKDLLKSLLTLIVVSGAGLTVIGLSVAAADAFSVWVLEGATNCDVDAGPADGESTCFGTTVGSIVMLSSTSPIGMIGVLILGSLALLMAYVQVALMIVRGGMLVVLAGILPLTASFTNTEMGSQWFKKTVGWTIAFILYKPAAALIYAAAFQMTGADVFRGDGGGIWTILTGLAMMLIVILALPALLRFVAPMTAAIGGGGTAAMALGAAGVAGAAEMATGAIRRASSNSGSSGSSSSAPNGSSPSNNGGKQAPPTPTPTGGPGSTGAAASTAGGGSAAGGAAAGGAGAGAAAAAGPIGAGVAIGAQVIQKAKETGQAAAGAIRSAAEDSAGPSGA